MPQPALRDSLPRPVATGVAGRPRARTAKHGTRSMTGRAPALFAHPGLRRDCVETGLVGLPLPMDPSDLEGDCRLSQVIKGTNDRPGAAISSD